MQEKQTSSRFLVGAAKTIITPKLGTRLFGYPSDRFATTIHDDLTATAIAVSDGKSTAVIVSATICVIPGAVTNKVIALVNEKVAVKHILLCATHTHSGPALSSMAGWGDADASYVDDIFVPRVVEAICSAVNAMEDAKMGIGEINSNVGINRRQVKENGNVCLGRNPLGIYDPRMRVIAFESLDGERTLGTIVHFGAHGTAAGGPCPDSPVTRDWPGVMTDRLEWMTGAPCAYLNGAEGDVAPRDYNRVRKDKEEILDNIDQAMEIGGMAAVDAAQAYCSITDFFVPELTVQTGEIRLPYDPLPDKETIEKEMKILETKYPDPRMDYALKRERHRWETILEALKGEPKKALCYPQTLVKIGPVVIVPHPFEIFTAIAMRLDSFSPVKYTLSTVLTNDTFGYLPNKEEICRGGYEIWSFKSGAPYTLTDDTDTELIKQNLSMIRKMIEE